MKIQLTNFFVASSIAVAAFGQLRTPVPQQPQSQTQQQPERGAPADTTKPEPSAVGQAVDPRTYLMGAEDIIYVFVWRQPDFSRAHIIRSDGKISLPLAGEVEAGGKTPDALAKDITKALSEYLNKPDVSVSVQQVNSKKVFVDGEVMRPGSFPLVGKTSVLEALTYAGGFREFANRKKITILRGTQTYKFNWMDVSKGKKMEQNILLEPGDHVFVK